jgi:monoterpene epsilon-lactone hydrolase
LLAYPVYVGLSRRGRLTLSEPRTQLVLPVKLTQRHVTCDVWWPPTVDHNSLAKVKNAIVYLHGGGVCSGNLLSAAPFSNSLLKHLCDARVNDVVVITVDFVLSTHAAFPAPLEDCVCVCEHLSALNITQVLVGDSGGGTLVASVLLELKQSSIKGAFLISPMLDNTHHKLYHDTNENLDIIQSLLANGTARQLCECPVQSATDMLVSPILAEPRNLAHFPPILLHCGTCEIFYSDCLVFANKLRLAGVPLEFCEFPGLVHCFQFVAPDREESKRSLRDFAAFCARVV